MEYSSAHSLALAAADFALLVVVVLMPGVKNDEIAQGKRWREEWEEASEDQSFTLAYLERGDSPGSRSPAEHRDTGKVNQRPTRA